MQAGDIMTKEIVAATPEMPLRDVARLLLEHGISAAPVVDASGAVLGMVSDGDLIGRSEAEREARRDWWLALLAEGEALHPDFLASLRQPQRTAGEVMSAPVVTVGEHTEVQEIARLLAAYRVKRVPVVREGRIVGIVSRADLLRAFAAEPPPTAAHPSPTGGLLTGALSAIDAHFLQARHPAPGTGAPQTVSSTEAALTAEDFNALIADFEERKAERGDDSRRAAADLRRKTIKELISNHVPDGAWQSLLHQARTAAEHGERECLLLRFPSDLCGDGGRAINAPLPSWPATLRGEAAEIYLRWEQELKPHGFHLSARVLDFPDGMPGDIGLFLVWGK